MMRFGPSGNPGAKTMHEAVGLIKEMGLDAFELALVHQARTREGEARLIAEEAKKHDVSISAHAPYYVNLLTPDKAKLEASRKRILDTCRIVSWCGGGKVVFHPAYYGNFSKEKAIEKVIVEVEHLQNQVKTNNFNAILALETTGKHSAFGSLEETLAVCKAVKGVSFCIDFAHLYARCGGCVKTKEDFAMLLKLVRTRLGERALKDLHCHFSGIHYTEKGERNHLPISSNSPPFKPLAEALHAFNCSGTIICEAPDPSGDALKMKTIY
ncbi:MAG: TIM barrel protein, partial [Candidatus Micrarchaeota archaeon]